VLTALSSWPRNGQPSSFPYAQAKWRALVARERHGVDPHQVFNFIALRGDPLLTEYELAKLADAGSAGSRASTAIS
jgi:hypothetical protein